MIFCSRADRGLSRALAMAAFAVVLTGMTFPAVGGEIHLKNGTIISGTPIRVKSIGGPTVTSPGEFNYFSAYLIDSGPQRYFVPIRQAESVNWDADMASEEFFEVPQQLKGRRMTVHSVGALEDATPFDEFGRRRVMLSTSRGAEPVIQGITEITPKNVSVTSTSHFWDFGLATSSIPTETLDAMIRKVTDPANPDDRMAIARFYIQAGLYSEANAELLSIAKDFPELSARVAESATQLAQLQAQEWHAEMLHRSSAGQHRLVYELAKMFPTEGINAALLNSVRELLAEYDDSLERRDTALATLEAEQAKLTDAAQVTAVMPMRTTVTEELTYDSIGRLDAFLNLSKDSTLSPAEKLALAYSGWVVGSAHAITDLDQAVRLWEARFLAGEYLRSVDPNRQEELISKLSQLEGMGPSTMVNMIPQLPLPIETPDIWPGVAKTLNATGPNGLASITYSVLLPPEYNPNRAYPMIVALRPAERSAEQVLAWWGGTADKPRQSQRHGYIVIAPEYAADNQQEYGYGGGSHDAVIMAIQDARKRFNVDSDRIFLSGHGMGGDAAFDIGMSHPDVFAGVIPIAGICEKTCLFYWENCKQLPFYIVNGELDNRLAAARDTVVMILDRMMKRHDVIYAEYIGRGYESFYEEIHKLFDWMSPLRRLKYPSEFEVGILRPSDNRFFWLEMQGFPKNVTPTPFADPAAKRIIPMSLSCRVLPGANSITIKSGADRNTVWLAPEFVNFDERLSIRVNGRRKYSDFVKGSIRDILEDLRVRGDRQKIYWARVDLD